MDEKTKREIRELACRLRGDAEFLDSILDFIDTELADITAYSQNDPRWAGQVYAGGLTFASDGCYVIDVAMIASYAGYTDTPPETAAKLRAANCFNGAMLSYPQRIPDAYDRLEWPAGAYYNRPGDRLDEVHWQTIRVHLDQIGPLILKVDYKPENYHFNMHFVLATKMIGDDDLEIIDPIDGQRSTLLDRYGRTRCWVAEQAIFGWRGLRVGR